MLIRKWRSCRFNKEKQRKKKLERSEREGPLAKVVCVIVLSGGVTQKPGKKKSISTLSLCSLFFNSRPRDQFTNRGEGRFSSLVTSHTIHCLCCFLKIKYLQTGSSNSPL